MSTSAMKILCRYQYDPLDRLTGLKPAEHVGTQRFYQNDELDNEIEGQVELTIVRHEAQPLAQRLHIANVTETTLLATDQQRSVLQTLAGVDTQRMAYTAYGHRPAESGLSSLLGFNGERSDPVTGHYLLGQGNRAFNSVLMRFNSPDELSPFGDGGINAYAYCSGDPVNRYDPSGNISFSLWKQFRKITTLRPAQEVALDLSIPRTVFRSPQTEAITPQPQPTLFQRDPPVVSQRSYIKLKYTPEGKSRGPKPAPPQRSGSQQAKNAYQERLVRAARDYDRRAVPHDPEAGLSELLASYRTSEEELKALRNLRALKKDINRARKKSRNDLQRLKRNILIIQIKTKKIRIQ
ncbi:RHS repeat-associated core domain-containing protein [Pseudomonas kilonensis]|uniref:RHS repeat-associated core domain-containing protein n=1 Tax=Pseudomonas kilonensis TaxID=132476 RepID=UPI0033966229